LKAIGGAAGKAAIRAIIIFSAVSSERLNQLKVGVALHYGEQATEYLRSHKNTDKALFVKW
jgi:hypothetical protein